jgi:acetyltransferase EpsM
LSKRIIIFGAGGHGRVAADCAMASGLAVAAFLDDNVAAHGQVRLGIRVVGGRSEAVDLLESHSALVAIGDNATRAGVAAWLKEHGGSFETVCHPAATVGRDVAIGAGSLVVAGAVVNTGTKIGLHVIVNTLASVDHDCTVSDFAHISPGAHLASGVTVGTGAHIGTGVSVIPGVKIGEWSVVGAGAAVVRDVPAGVVVAGVPARVIRLADRTPELWSGSVVAGGSI